MFESFKMNPISKVYIDLVDPAKKVELNFVGIKYKRSPIIDYCSEKRDGAGIVWNISY